MPENTTSRSIRKKTRRGGRKYQQRKRRALLIQLLNAEGIQVPGINAPRETSAEDPVSDSTSIIKAEPSSPPTSEEQTESN